MKLVWLEYTGGGGGGGDALEVMIRVGMGLCALRSSLAKRELSRNGILVSWWKQRQDLLWSCAALQPEHSL